MNSIVGRRIFIMMWDRHETQKTVARHLGIAQNSLSNKLHGHRGFDVNELMALADYFGVDASTLIRRPGEGDEPVAPAPAGKQPDPDGGGQTAGPTGLPGLDSNQQPCGYHPGNVVQLSSRRRRAANREAAAS